MNANKIGYQKGIQYQNNKYSKFHKPTVIQKCIENYISEITAIDETTAPEKKVHMKIKQSLEEDTLNPIYPESSVLTKEKVDGSITSTAKLATTKVRTILSTNNFKTVNQISSKSFSNKRLLPKTGSKSVMIALGVACVCLGIGILEVINYKYKKI